MRSTGGDELHRPVVGEVEQRDVAVVARENREFQLFTLEVDAVAACQRKLRVAFAVELGKHRG